MKATAMYPLSALHGSITPDHYCRMLNGKLIVQRKPRQTSPRQQAMRQAFAETYRHLSPPTCLSS